MITLYAAMLVTLGLLIAALIAVVVLPAYRRRIERFTSEALKRTLPLTEAEIRADKDRLRAEFAMELHRLESKVEEGGLAAARQSVELNRRDAKIQELTEAIANQKMSVEEHENARRVLEQAILDRLPKVEQRLAETRKLLATRDREIKNLVATGAKQAAALDEATQLNAQQSKELARLRVTLDTRAARNRDGLGDSRFDGGVALRTELEALREQVREQNSLIDKLQASAANAKEHPPADAADAGETQRLVTALAEAESELAALKASADDAESDHRAQEERIATLAAANEAKATELAKLKAALEAYKTEAAVSPDLAQKAEIEGLLAETESQRRMIALLRAELAAAQERLSRQAQHFRDEVRRRGTALDADIDVADNVARPSLAERIAAPRTPREQRSAVQLHAVNGNGASAQEEKPSAEIGAETQVPPPLPPAEAKTPSGAVATPRRPRLLERISGLDKR